MNKFRFFAVEETYCTPENCSYTAYSIYAEELTSQGWVHALSIPDVSCDKGFAMQLAEQCTRIQLSPMHLLDVVLDMLP